MKVRIGAGVIGWPFPKVDPGYVWEFIDMSEELGIDSIWLADRIVSPAVSMESMTFMAAWGFWARNPLTVAPGRERASVSSKAVPVAERGSPSRMESSPTKSPGFKTLTVNSRPSGDSTTVLTLPDSTM